jgi:hypothetical protein
LFQPAGGVDFEASVRLHRVERSFEYSYRLLAVVHWSTRLGGSDQAARARP